MTTGKQELSHPAHAWVWDALPWYHNGGLAPAERHAVDTHLGECLVCTREVRRLKQLTVALAAPATDQSCAHAFGRLSAQIRARENSWHGRLLGALRRRMPSAPLLTGLAAAAMCAMVVALSTTIAQPITLAQHKSFQTLGRQQVPAAELSHPLLRIVVRDADHVATRSQWLGRHDAMLIDGPSEIGVLTVKVGLGPRSLNEVIESMRADADTLFVEPLSQIGSRPDRRR